MLLLLLSAVVHNFVFTILVNRYIFVIMMLKNACSKFCLVTKLDQLEMRYRSHLNIHKYINNFSFIKVQIEDQVILTSECVKGLYVHTSIEMYDQAGITLNRNWLVFHNKVKESF